ncbi:HAD-IIIA family hydrolase [Paraneptunicella aestuarii]|uniref:KdsC family phosphatase n=1 Tax=Paraneptunicella aestuarii TaxID=2831148 RepID=UPI001E37145A|nr:HAD-IIIA family hydrolase [Paraneptunicella aestuarii]UAA39541.1 HAD-IIIA family hydrolase [Paraneptunicella aestuarii]
MRQSDKQRLQKQIANLIAAEGLPASAAPTIEAAFLLWQKDGLESHRNNAIPAQKLQPIEYVFFDFDGVMTDNKVYTDQHGNESVMCDRADGLGIKQLKQQGKQVYILSTEANPVVTMRAKKLNIECFHNCSNKAEFMLAWMQDNCVQAEEVAFVGNDINDLEVMKVVGLALCPADSDTSILAIADYVIPRNGGDRVVREVASLWHIE